MVCYACTSSTLHTDGINLAVPGGFSAFTGGSLPGMGVSPKEVNVPGIGGVGLHGHAMKGGDSPPADVATKQYVL